MMCYHRVSSILSLQLHKVKNIRIIFFYLQNQRIINVGLRATQTEFNHWVLVYQRCKLLIFKQLWCPRWRLNLIGVIIGMIFWLAFLQVYRLRYETGFHSTSCATFVFLSKNHFWYVSHTKNVIKEFRI